MIGSAETDSPLKPGITLGLDQLIRLKQQAIKYTKTISRISCQTTLTGAQQSRLKGRGMDFDEVRHYFPGDEIRHMDWRVTARSGTPHTKLFREERARPILFYVHFDNSMFFGTRAVFKSVLAAQTAALLGWCHTLAGDRVGGVISNGLQTRIIKPQAGNQGIFPLLRTLTTYNNQGVVDTPNPQQFHNTIQRLRSIARPGSLVYLLSDFYHVDRNFEQLLHQLSTRCEVVLIFLYDQLEAQPPPANLYVISDGTARHTIDTHDAAFCLAYQQQFGQRYLYLQRLCKKPLVFLPLATHQNPSELFNNLGAITRS